MDKATPTRGRGLNGMSRRTVLTLTVVVVLALVGSASWVAANQKSVAISADGKTIELTTFKNTVGEVLKEASISIGPTDEVKPGIRESLGRKQKIIVLRPVLVRVLADDYEKEVLTTKDTVGQVLIAAGTSVGDLDKVTPAKDTPVTPGMRVEVIRVREDVSVVKASIPFPVQKREDDTLAGGATKVLQQGENGLKETRTRVIYENGKKASSSMIEARIVKEPVPQIIAYGTSGTITRGGQTIRFRKALDVSSTAYYPGPDSTGYWADGYTSIGMKATYGVVAVDPKVIPLRSRLYIDGYGYAIAGDVGSAIKGLKIDLCFDTKSEALKWGRKKTTVYLLD